MKYVKSHQIENNDVINYMVEKYHLPIQLSDYVYYLGYKTKKDVDDYLKPTKALFYDPFLFPDMQKIVERITTAIAKKERIVIFGDYDVDGIGSTYILIKYFEEVGVNVNYFLPSRYNDGYGLTYGSIDKVIEMYNPNLIITVDCGITCVKEVEYIKQQGIDVIITDHHEPGETLPNCLKIDCKLENQEYPFKCLCGAGMALKLVCALSDYQTCKKYMTACAISTIADIVELEDENRFIVQEGLKHYSDNCPKGLKHLIKQCKIFGTPTSKDISYKIAPKLNATGRMGDASISLKLYLATELDSIKALTKEVLKMNDRRQELCLEVFDQAIEQMEKSEHKNDKIIVLKSDNWECGILGIVCSKLVEKYHRPTILMGLDERTQMYSGSARSYAEFDLHSAMEQNINLLNSFGGHKYACGFSLKGENFKDFYQKMQQFVPASEEQDVTELYDIDIEEKNINKEFVDKLSLLEPFGIANPEPTFKVVLPSLTVSPMPNHFEHLILDISNKSGLIFGKSKGIYTLSLPIKKDVYMNINKDFFIKPTIKLIVKDYSCKEAISFNKEIVQGVYNSLIFYDNYKIVEDVQSNLINTNGKNILHIMYSNIEKYNDAEVNYINLSNRDKETILVSPLNFNNLEGFEKIVFEDELPNLGVINFLKEKYPQTIVEARVKENFVLNKGVSFSFLNLMYNSLKKIKEPIFDEIYLYKKFFVKQGVKFENFLLMFRILENMKYLEFNRNEYKICVLSKDEELNKSDIQVYASKFNLKVGD